MIHRHIVVSFGDPESRTPLPPTGRFHRLKSILAAVLLASVLAGALMAAILVGSILAALIIVTVVIALAVVIGRTVIARARR